MQALSSDVYRQEVWSQVKEVVAFVEQAVEARSAVHELERGLWERMLALGHGCLKLFFSLCGDGDQGAELCLPGGPSAAAAARAPCALLPVGLRSL
jgi:hypothetical protein